MFTQNDVDTYQFIRGTELKKRETLWGTVYLNTTTGSVHFVERWLYDFTLAPGQPAWTDDEKSAYHAALSAQVTGTWDSQTPVGPQSDPVVQQFLNSIRKAANVRLQVTGWSEFAKRFAGKGMDIDFDIVLTSAQPHWHVTVRKLPQDDASANVNWDSRRVRLTSFDNRQSGATQAGRNGASTQDFVASPHEFGHTLINDDEYTTSSGFRPDLKSIMNIGHEVRPRHYRFITQQLNVIMPGCTFRAVNA